MKFVTLFVSFFLIGNVVGGVTLNGDDEADNLFTIPLPEICVKSRSHIYSELIKRSNSNFIMVYQKYLGRSCHFSNEVVQIVEAYRNAANYVVIILNKSDATDSQFNEIVKFYNSELLRFNEGIRKMAVKKRLSNACYDSLMLIRRVAETTGEGLVVSTSITYKSKCSSTSRPMRRSTLTTPTPIAATLPDRPLDLVSNYLS